MREALISVPTNGLLPEVVEIEVVTDLFELPRVEITRSIIGGSAQCTAHVFAAIAEAGDFFDRLTGALKAEGFVERGENDACGGSATPAPNGGLAKLLHLVEALRISAPGWVTTSGTERRLACLSVLVGAAWPGRGGHADHQLDLFDQEFHLVEAFYEHATEIAAEIVAVLMPHHALRGRMRKRFIQQFTRRSREGVTRLADDRAEARSWSLHSVMDRDPRTFAAVRRMARRRIFTVGELVALTEREAHALARVDLGTWLAICSKLTGLGLSFAVEGERIALRRAATRCRRSAA